MTQDTKVRFIVILALALLFGYVVAPIPNKPNILGLADMNLKFGIDLDGGAELRYRVLYERTDKDRTNSTQIATDVIRKRVEARKLQEPIITSQGDDQIIIQLAGMDKAGVEEIKRLIETAGDLELFAVANREIQEKYNRDKVQRQRFRVLLLPAYLDSRSAKN